MRILAALFLSLFLGLALGKSVIVPGAVWYDTDGNEIQAHGAGILEVRTVYRAFRALTQDVTGWRYLLLVR